MAATHTFDVLIIGSGGAGLGLALQLPDHLQVAVLSKSRLEEGCTLYAQGGISAVTDPADSVESHVADTLSAGAGLNKPEVVRFCCRGKMHELKHVTRILAQNKQYRGAAHYARAALGNGFNLRWLAYTLYLNVMTWLGRDKGETIARS